MRLNDKGEVTIPAVLCQKYDLHVGDEIEIIDDGHTLRIVKSEQEPNRGRRLIEQMRGKATTQLSTDQLMALLRGE